MITKEITFTPIEWGPYLATRRIKVTEFPDSSSGLQKLLGRFQYGKTADEVKSSLASYFKSTRVHPFGKPPEEGFRRYNNPDHFRLFSGSTDMCEDMVHAHLMQHYELIHGQHMFPQMQPNFCIGVFLFPAKESRPKDHMIYYSFGTSWETLIIGPVTDFSGAGKQARHDIDSMLLLMVEVGKIDIECYTASDPVDGLLRDIQFRR